MSSTTVIAGLDEAGRGPLAGPVVAAACIIPHPLIVRIAPFRHWKPRGMRACPFRIADSKKLTGLMREHAFAWISTTCPHGIGSASAEEIDAIGIKAATHTAMQRALASLAQHIDPSHLLVDGNDRFTFPWPHTSIIGGDEKEPCIAAASILAKVTRDRLMDEAALTHPHYGFDRHKGYGAATHIAAIKEYGPCVLHRRSFLTRIVGEPVVD